MLKTHIPALLGSVTLFVPYDGGDKKPGWKLTEDGKAIMLKDGNPVWVNSDGTEATLGGDTIANLNREAKGHREAKERIEGELAELKTKFKDLDPDKARSALETVSKLDQKKLIDAGEVDKVKDSMRSEFQALVDAAKKEAEDARGEVNTLKLETAFGGSKFITDKMIIPADIAQSVFGKNFKIEDGKIVGYYGTGDKIMSKEKIGEVAGFDEALSLVVQAYPNKDTILKGGNHGGSGNGGGGGGGKPGSARYTRSEYEKLPPVEQAKVAGEVRAGTAELVD